ncbi:hypothetical protein [Prevotellamassilia timonensis]|uniref:hypothetical protein n=1 Tax=Prevotellamassilia timonensis TaxID=1852370 RepID=UPI0030793241
MGLLKKLILIIVLFLIICKPEFVFIPFGVNRFFGVLGLFVFFADAKAKHKIIDSSRASLKKIIKTLIPVVVLSFVSLVLNGTSDIYFPKYTLSIILGFFAAYFWAYLLYKFYSEVDINTICNYYTTVVVLFVAIAFICFLQPSVYDTLVSYERIDEIALISMERTEGTRLIGIGANFFTAAVINGTLLILLAAYIVSYNHSTKHMVVLIVSYALITVLGMMMARTTLFGALLGFVIILINIISSTRKFFKITGSLLIILILLFIMLDTFGMYSSDKMDTLTSFGFEMFENKQQNGGKFETSSMHSLYRMWNTIPSDIKTWIIGDGLWEDHGFYYKNVDLGYLRNLWYFGLLGSFFIYRFYYKTIKTIFIEKAIFNSNHRLVAYALIMFVVVINAKGPGDLFFSIIPFYFVHFQNNRKY